LRRLADYPDRRIKPIVSLMVSTGIRIGAFEEQAKEFLRQGKLNPTQAMDSIMRFVTFQIERAPRNCLSPFL
jgi:hypothetical protein